MSNVSTKKVFIQIESAAEQQEHLKKQRQTLKVLQGVSTDKENLTGRSHFDKLSRLKASTEASSELSKRKKIETRAAETQTSPEKNTRQITANDLTSEAKPSEFYFECLAEKRREALEESLSENQRLHERIGGLEEELNTSRQMLEEARNLVEVLTEMLNENEAEQEIENAQDEDATDDNASHNTKEEGENDDKEQADDDKATQTHTTPKE